MIEKLFLVERYTTISAIEAIFLEINVNFVLIKHTCAVITISEVVVVTTKGISSGQLIWSKILRYMIAFFINQILILVNIVRNFSSKIFDLLYQPLVTINLQFSIFYSIESVSTYRFGTL